MGIKTLKMRLEPNREQRDSIDDTIDYNRYVYNALITYCKLHYRRYSKLPSEFDLNYVCTRIRKNHNCFRIPSSLSHNDISKRVYQGCKRCLDDSMKEWKRKVGRKEIDPSEPMRISWPRYKSATRYKSYAINQAYEVVETRNAKGKKVRKLKLPKIKQPIRCYNQGTRRPGKPKVCIISRKDEGTYYSYWASIVCESEDDPKEHPEHPRAVGIDLGLRHLIATSDGHIEDNDHVYWNRLHQLKKESERFSESMHHTTEGRKRRNRLNHLYTKISNIRKNRIENIT